MKTFVDLGVFVLLLANLHIIQVLAATTNMVTCGSVVKLLNVDYRSRLHSHDVKYGTGSGQQSVTGVETADDVNSHWVIKGPTGKVCPRGAEINCGDTIRLQHLATLKNLHSHIFSSPLSGNQEISAYGDTTGEGDTGDHWEVICNDVTWQRHSKVQLRHIDTRKFLGMSGRSFGRPISGQMEVCGLPSGNTGSEWQTAEGVFVHPAEIVKENLHTEL